MLNFFRWASLVAAIVLLLALAGLLISSSQPNNPPYEHAKTENGEKQENKKKDVALWDRLFPDSISLYTLFLVVFTGVLAYASIYQFRFLNRAERIAISTAQSAKDSADAAKQSAQVARDTLIVSNRPWVSIEDPILAESDFTWEEKGARVVIGMTIKNVGKSPAFDIAIEARPFVFSREQPSWKTADAVAKFCAEVRHRQMLRSAQGQRGEVLFPDQSLPKSHGLLFLQQEVEAGILDVAGTPMFSPLVVVCIDYRSPITDQSHATGLAFLFLKAPSNAFTLREPLKRERFGLVRAPFGSFAN